jgi:hypothetical protein
VFVLGKLTQLQLFRDHLVKVDSQAPLVRISTSEDVSIRMHEAGLNLRYLGVLYSQLCTERANADLHSGLSVALLKGLVGSGMVARALKTQVQSLLRRARNAKEYLFLVVHYFNLLLSRGPDSQVLDTLCFSPVQPCTLLVLCALSSCPTQLFFSLMAPILLQSKFGRYSSVDFELRRDDISTRTLYQELKRAFGMHISL